MVSFMSCVLSLQAAVSRLIYSFARDGMVAGSAPLSRVSTRHVPVNALYLSGLVPGAIVLLGLFAQDALTTIVSFAVVGIYVAFQMVVAGALYARLRGWQPGGPFTLGRWGFAVNIAALAYGVLAIINILWPRMPDAHGISITACGSVLRLWWPQPSPIWRWRGRICGAAHVMRMRG